MIGDIIGQSLRQPSRLIPVEALLGNCDGSRMPDVIADRLTPAIAQRLVEVCPTAALGMTEHEGRACPQVVLRALHWLWEMPGIWRRSRRRSERLPSVRCHKRADGAALGYRRPRGNYHCWSEPGNRARANSLSFAKSAEHSSARCRFLQRMRGGNHRSHEPVLRSGTIRDSFRGVSKTCRHAPGDRTGHPKHGRSRQGHVRGRPGAKIGRRRRSMRVQWRNFRRQPRNRWRGRRSHPRGWIYPRLSTDPRDVSVRNSGSFAATRRKVTSLYN